MSEDGDSTAISVEIMKDGSFRLLEDVQFEITDMCGVHFKIVVPAQFLSDGASIPRCFWSIIGAPISGDWLECSIIHDWMTVQAKSYRERRLADTIFLHMLEEAKVAKWRRVLMYLAVRLYARLFVRFKD